MKNPYLPMPMRIDHITVETSDGNIKTFTLSFIRDKDRQAFRFIPGQFAEVGALLLRPWRPKGSPSR